MFDISWGEIVVLTSVGLVLVGRKDLPLASHAFGQQIVSLYFLCWFILYIFSCFHNSSLSPLQGRIVGLLQGARLRADRFVSRTLRCLLMFVMCTTHTDILILHIAVHKN